MSVLFTAFLYIYIYIHYNNIIFLAYTAVNVAVKRAVNCNSRSKNIEYAYVPFPFLVSRCSDGSIRK